MEDRVGVRELRQNLSRYLDRVKDGASLVVTERGREVARLVPSGPPDDPVARLVTERGATPGRGNLAEFRGRRPPPGGPTSEEILAEQRADRV